MRSLTIAAALVTLLCWSAPSNAGLEDASADGWHTWRVERSESELVHFYVLVENGKPVRIHSMSWDCGRPTRDEANDLGTVSAVESYRWFRSVVEDADVEQDIRDAALFGLVESGTDDAFDYIDRILSRR